MTTTTMMMMMMMVVDGRCCVDKCTATHWIQKTMTMRRLRWWCWLTVLVLVHYDYCYSNGYYHHSHHFLLLLPVIVVTEQWHPMCPHHIHHPCLCRCRCPCSGRCFLSFHHDHIHLPPPPRHHYLPHHYPPRYSRHFRAKEKTLAMGRYK